MNQFIHEASFQAYIGIQYIFSAILAHRLTKTSYLRHSKHILYLQASVHDKQHGSIIPRLAQRYLLQEFIHGHGIILKSEHKKYKSKSNGEKKKKKKKKKERKKKKNKISTAIINSEHKKIEIDQNKQRKKT
jgi:hypothetical protein